MTGSAARAPLVGLRVVEFASIGPGPHCAMLLSDLGAEVVRIDREGGNGWPNPVADRRATLTVDIRTQAGWCALLEGTDACFAPVLSLEEGTQPPAHEGARGLCGARWSASGGARAAFLANAQRHPGNARGAHDDRRLAQRIRRTLHNPIN